MRCFSVMLGFGLVLTIAAFEESLTAAKPAEWLPKLQKRERNGIAVQLPKVKVTAAFQLNKVLGEMGMPSAFRPGEADFSGMNGRKDLALTAVVHKAFVEVNEEGTEAAAATGVGGEESAPPSFRANHPFVFLIRDNRTSSILFLGRVVNPLPK